MKWWFRPRDDNADLHPGSDRIPAEPQAPKIPDPKPRTRFFSAVKFSDGTTRSVANYGYRVGKNGCLRITLEDCDNSMDMTINAANWIQIEDTAAVR